MHICVPIFYKLGRYRHLKFPLYMVVKEVEAQIFYISHHYFEFESRVNFVKECGHVSRDHLYIQTTIPT
jgi:hypothetical protein